MKFFLAFAFVAIAVLISTVADILLKKSQLQDYSLISWGVVLYAVCALPVAAAFKLIDFSTAFFIWEAIAVTCGLVLGIMMFKEHFSVLKLVAFVSAMTALIFSYFASR